MGTTAQKLQAIIDSKEQIRLAINNQGVNVNTSVQFDEYDTKINQISDYDYEVVFVDYDGTILSRQFLISGEDAVEPTKPTIDNMTIEGWNNTFTNITDNKVIGLVRKTTDNITYITITLNSITGLIVPLNYYAEAGGNVTTINWGDNSTNSTTNTLGAQRLSHTYSSYGTYTIKISGSDYLFLGGGTDALRLMGGLNETIKSIKTSSWIRKINNYGLSYASNLQSINLSNSFNEVSDYSFQYATKLKGIVIPTNVTTIGTSLGYSFFHCETLSSVSLSSGITRLYVAAFYSCKNLENIHLPSTITRLDNQSLMNCRFTSLIIPSALSTAGTQALSTIYTEKLVLPNTLTEIGTQTFENNWALKEVTLGNAINNVKTGAFRYCYNLTSLDFPSTLNASVPSGYGINIEAFRGCYNIMDYYFRGTTPPPLLNANAFTDINPLCTIHVPASALSAYQSALNWSTYANYMIGDL